MTTKRQFTWQELASLNKEHNAHLAVRGKVRNQGTWNVESAQILNTDHMLLVPFVFLVFSPKFKNAFRHPGGNFESVMGD